MLKKIFYYIVRPKELLICLTNKNILFLLPDNIYVRLKYLLTMNKKLDLENPKSFNEKLQWLKLYDHNPLYTNMVDKYRVREYIKEKIGEEYLIPLLGVYDKFDDINFDELPNQFVIKCNHDSGGLIICRNKNELNKKETKKKINKYFKRNYYMIHREWPYKNVKRKIIIEEYMKDKQAEELRDYKFFCFNGEPRMMYIATDREKHETKFNYFDISFNKLNIKQHYPNSTKTIEKPKNFELMIELSRKLSKNIPHIRVDFYEINGEVFFGELTFYHFSGFVPFEPEKWDYKLGDMLKLPLKRK